MEPSLLEQLKMYNQTDYYPFHMPGHKRNPQIDYIPVEIDITEIEGFDNLHHAEGVLKQAQERASRLYGAEESFFLINGSTAGILAAISATVPNGGTILLARNSHKAAYHGAFLRNLKVEYIYPEVLDSYGICGGVNPQEIEKALKNNPAIKAVFITSPTYEGMVSNIEEIADIVHRNGSLLIVDEAHGAHLGIAGEAFPKGALMNHADIVIQSLHKTLPSMTQTAILHVQGSRVNRASLRKYLQIYQTSSPSYVFMAGMDSCIRLLENRGKELFEQYAKRLEQFYEEVKKLKFFHVLNPRETVGLADIYAMDPSKICIFTSGAAMSGARLYDVLLEKYHLQMEMTAGNYVLAMTSVMDTDDGFKRLSRALHQLDNETAKRQAGYEKQDMLIPKSEAAEVVMTAAEVEGKESEIVSLKESEGKISKEYRYVYPPGVPVLVPGERISRQVLDLLNYYKETDLNVLGQEHGEKVIEVVKDF